MLWAFAIVILVAGIYVPGWWAKKVLTRHSTPRIDIPQSGSEFAQSLLSHVQLTTVRVKPTAPDQDHYDPSERTVCLSPIVHGGRNLTAIVAAAHEVGHAMQHAEGYWLLELRTRLVALAQRLEKVGSIVLVAAPFVGLFTRNPRVTIVMVMFMLGTMLASTLVHLITLPVELDASFKRALPYLEQADFMHDRDLVSARKILKACALTYLAGSMASLLNLFRWLRILKR